MLGRKQKMKENTCAIFCICLTNTPRTRRRVNRELHCSNAEGQSIMEGKKDNSLIEDYSCVWALLLLDPLPWGISRSTRDLSSDLSLNLLDT